MPVTFCEDETGIIGEVVYSQREDVLLGFCGPEGVGHQCEDHFVVEVQDGEQGYNNILNAFAQNKIGNYARAEMPTLPVLAVLVRFYTSNTAVRICHVQNTI